MDQILWDKRQYFYHVTRKETPVILQLELPNVFYISTTEAILYGLEFV
jgi:hypothetical protein